MSFFESSSRVFQFSLVVLAVASAIVGGGCNREAAPTAATPAGAKAEATTSTAAAASAKSPGGTEKSSSSSSANSASSGAVRRAAENERDRARQLAVEQVPVETANVVLGPISAFLSFNSTLETESTVDIFPQTAGQVETLFVEEGRVVKEGDPLLKIEDRELRVDVDEGTANYEHLQKNFGRSEDLYERNLINKQDFETQTYQLEQARLRLERAKIRLAYTTVRAPFAGVISARETQVGARVGTGTKVFSMVKLDDIVARVFVPGRYLPLVKENQPAVVTSEFLPDRSFQGWVKRISPVIDPKSGTFKVTIGVRGEKPSELPPGLFVGVRVITDTRDSAVLIPKRAVVYEGGERYVFIIVEGRAVKRKLVPGYEDPTNIEAKSGFEVGMPVIVLGHGGLKDGAAVRPVNALTPIPPTTPDGTPAPSAPSAPSSSTEPKKEVATKSDANGTKS